MSNVIDLTPTWETAARIYCAVLQNPDADAVAKEDAQADLIRLGQYVDRLKALREENSDA